MRVVIIEDEKLAAESLQDMILKHRLEAEIAPALSSVEEAVEWFQLNAIPDLIFCDIHLSDGISFEIFRQVTIKCPIIFTTAYNQYAIQAFQVNSVDYLLKPVKEAELVKAIRKYEDLQKNNFQDEMENLKRMLQAENSSFFPSQKKRFMVKSGQSIKSVSSEDVAYFLAEEGVVFLITFDNGRFIINYTLEQLEEQLDPAIFFRVNRQLLVHIKAVKQVSPYFKGRLQLQIAPNGPEDQVVSSNKASSFKKWLDL